MLIQPEPLKHWIDNFYGYGSWESKMWFISHEESGGDLPEEEAEKFNYFYNAQATHSPSMCDIRALYRNVIARLDGPRAHLFSTLFDYRFGPDAVQHGLWKNLISFAHGYEGKTSPDLLQYQKESFLAPASKQEALISLYPLPTHNHAWYYSWLELSQYPFLKSRTLFQEHVYETRMQVILGNIERYSPAVVMMYGMGNINTLKATIKEKFPAADFKMVKATKLQIPQHHIARLGNTTLVLTTQIPALRHNRIETGFDWYKLASDLASSSAE